MCKRIGIYIGREVLHAKECTIVPGTFVYYQDCTNDPEFVPIVRIWPLDRKVSRDYEIVCYCHDHRTPEEYVIDRYTASKNRIYFNYHNPYLNGELEKVGEYSKDPKLAGCDFDWIISEVNEDVSYVNNLSYFKHMKIYNCRKRVYEEINGLALIEDFLKYSTLVDLTDARRKYGKVPGFIDLVIPVSFDDMLKDELKKSLEKSALNSWYGVGGFTTNTEPFKVVKMVEKETKTMEKKTMTETDTFLKHINGITITSTYSKLHHGCGEPYYIYYPEMEITEEIADTLLAVLLTAKRDFIHKVVFNPEKGTTTISKGYGDPVTVKCKDAKFDYILGYNMAKSKMYLGSDDYNWFNKIKNHRKTHIEYTEKKPTKKGGKK